jgi:hypothetical protein
MKRKVMAYLMLGCSVAMTVVNYVMWPYARALMM